MGRTKRFSVLRRANKLAGGSGAANSALDKYIKYRKGETVPTYTRDAASKPGSYVYIHLKPFGIGGIEDTFQATISKRAFDKLGDLVEGVTVFNHESEAGTGDIINFNFIPAKAIVHISGTGTTEETSKITGLKYNKESGAASYTVPFGQKIETDTYLIVAGEIKDGVKAKNVEYTVNFTPELWLRI